MLVKIGGISFMIKQNVNPPLYTHTYKEIIYHHVCSRNTLFFFHKFFFPLLLLLLVSPYLHQPFWFCYGFPNPRIPPSPFLSVSLSLCLQILSCIVYMYVLHTQQYIPPVPHPSSPPPPYDTNHKPSLVFDIYIYIGYSCVVYVCTTHPISPPPPI